MLVRLTEDLNTKADTNVSGPENVSCALAPQYPRFRGDSERRGG